MALPIRNRPGNQPDERAEARQLLYDEPSSDRSFFLGDASQWSELRPAEQAEVILAAYQERLLPKLSSTERLLTRLAVEFGLEYCDIEELAVLFLDLAQEIRRHVQALEFTLATPSNLGSAFQSTVGDGDMIGLVARLDLLTHRCATDEQSPAGYAWLINALRQCRREFTDLVELEIELSH